MSGRSGRWGPLVRVAAVSGSELRLLALSIFLGTAAVAASVALLTASGYLISRAAERPEILSLTAVIVAVRAFAISRAVFRYGERLVSHDLAFRLLAKLRIRFFTQLAPLLPARSRSLTGGDLLSRFVGDVDSLQNLYLRALIPPVVAVVVSVAAGVAASAILPGVGPVLTSLLVVAGLSVALLSARISAVSGRRQAKARARLTGELVEAIDGAAEIAVAGHSENRIVRIETANQELARLARYDSAAAAATVWLGATFSYAVALAVLVVAIPAVGSGDLGGVWLAALVLLALAAFEAVAPLPVAAANLHRCREAAARLEEVCERQPAVTDPPEPKRLTGSGELALEAVCFSYDAKQPWLLEDVNLRLSARDRTVLMGQSGGGKTTLAQLLIRFFDPDQGRVTLDGIDLRELRQEDVRRSVVLAAQDTHIFNTTLRENLLLANRGSAEQDLWQALELVELAEWVRAQLPDGLDTELGESGAGVSGGQRQRISLARALIASPRFIVFDEPTAHLEPSLAARIVRRLTELPDTGLLVITHEGISLERFDRVLRLEDGRVSQP